tara:strand:- start:1209 stop:1670 length:462 start_codon:yes stop_codon:yes gene_type:complete
MFFSDNEKNKCLNALEELGFSKNKNCWIWKYPKRAIMELGLMKINTNSEFSQEGNRLIWTEYITNNFGSQFLISIEAKDYPFKMPKAFVKEPYIKPSHDKHMYTEDGSICYMHPNSYISKISILEIRNQICSWCFCIEVFSNTGKWPAAAARH